MSEMIYVVVAEANDVRKRIYYTERVHNRNRARVHKSE